MVLVDQHPTARDQEIGGRGEAIELEVVRQRAVVR